MKRLIFPLLTLLGACEFAAAEEDGNIACIEERFEMTRDQRRRGILLPADMGNIDFESSYARQELVARYRLHRGAFRRESPNPNDLLIARKLILDRSRGTYDPEEVITAEPCMYIEIIPPIFER